MAYFNTNVVLLDMKEYHVRSYTVEATAGLVANLAFFLVATMGIRMNRLPKVFYLFLLARSLSDVLLTGVILIMCILLLTTDTEPPEIAVRGAAATIVANVFRSVSLYFCLSATILLSLCRPLLYRRVITTRLCGQVIAAAWLVSTAFGALHLLPQRLVCPVDDAACRTFVRRRIDFGSFVLFLLYCGTLAFFAFVAVKAKRLRKEQEANFKTCPLNSRPATVGRLGVAVVSFGLFYMPMLLDRFVAVRLFDNCIPFGGHLCYSIFPHPYVYHFLLVRAAVDPLAAILVDARFFSTGGDAIWRRKATTLGPRKMGVVTNVCLSAASPANNAKRTGTTATVQSHKPTLAAKVER